MPIRIGILGDFSPEFPAHIMIAPSLQQAVRALGSGEKIIAKGKRFIERNAVLPEQRAELFLARSKARRAFRI